MFSAHKTTPWQFCGKQRQSGLVPFKSYKLEFKTRAKVFGKVDTTETYQTSITLIESSNIKRSNWDKVRVTDGSLTNLY